MIRRSARSTDNNFLGIMMFLEGILAIDHL